MQNIIQKSCPNFRAGRVSGSTTYKPELVVIHIMDGSLSGTDSWFNNPASQVSAHYGIGKTGEVHQYVKEADQAWHAGVVSKPSFKLYKGTAINPNLYTIGIEHEGKPLENDVWPAAMKNASAQLIADICTRWNIPIDRDHIIGHYQIRDTKPNCPAINKGIIDELVAMAQKIAGVATTPAAAAVRLVNDNGTVYMVAGVKDVRVVGIASQEAIDAMFGDTPIEKGSVKDLPKSKLTLGKAAGFIIS